MKVFEILVLKYMKSVTDQVLDPYQFAYSCWVPNKSGGREKCDLMNTWNTITYFEVQLPFFTLQKIINVAPQVA